MTLDELEQLIRRYLSTGIAVVVLLVTPGTDTGDAGSGGIVVQPAVPSDTGPVEDRSTAPDGAGSGDPTTRPPSSGGDRIDAGDRDPAGDDSTGAGGIDPDRPGTSPPDGDRDTERNDSNGDLDSYGDGDLDRNGDIGSDLDGNLGDGDAATAADRHGWGTPTRVDEFSGGTDQWSIYDGSGYAGQGTRSSSAISLENGILTITGDSSGTTGGMAWNPGQKYGRWEGRVRAPASDPSYDALLLLWPDAEDFPAGGEIDFMEMSDPSRQRSDIFIHYGSDNSQVNGQVEVNATEWHNWAVEWTPDAITAYLDGEEWYRTTDTSIFPPGPMHLCIQLDWFPAGDAPPQESIMQVDWVKQYSLDSNDDADGPGDGAGSERGTTGTETEGGTTGTGNDRREETGPTRETLRRTFTWG